MWVGYPKEQTPLLYVEGVPAVYGGTIPAAIWHDYMWQAMQLYPEAGAYDMPELTGTRGSVGAGGESHAPADRDPDALTFDRADAHGRAVAHGRAHADGDAESHGGAEGFLQATAIVPPENDRPTLGRHRQLTHRRRAEALGRFVQHGLALGRRVVHRQRRHDGGAATR